jgi:hypothetical protein
MNETTLAEPATPFEVRVTLAPWSRGNPDVDCVRLDVTSRVGDEGRSLILAITVGGQIAKRVKALQALLAVARTLIGADRSIRVTLGFSGVSLDSEALSIALDGWTRSSVPVHSLFAFDFSVEGRRGVPGCASRGLSPFVGQEVVCWPTHAENRRVAARMVVRLAHDLMIDGPIESIIFVAASDAPGGRVALVPRELPEPHVEIVFSDPDIDAG